MRFRSEAKPCKSCKGALQMRCAGIFSQATAEVPPAGIETTGRASMRFRHLTCVTALAAALLTPIGAQAFDDAKYPALKGQWRRVAVPSGRYPGVQYDPHKPAGP